MSVSDEVLRMDLRGILVDPATPGQMASKHAENNITLIIDYIRLIAPDLCNYEDLEPKSDDDLADMSGATGGDR